MPSDGNIRQPKKGQLARRLIESPSAGYLAQLLIEKHEGYSKFPSVKAHGEIKIGYGSDLTVRGLTELEAGLLLARDIAEIEIQLSKFGWWARLSPAQQSALIDMAYALGMDVFLNLKQAIAHLAVGEYPAAGEAMLVSEYWRSFGPRAQEDAALIAFGLPINKEEDV